MILMTIFTESFLQLNLRIEITKIEGVSIFKAFDTWCPVNTVMFNSVYFVPLESAF